MRLGRMLPLSLVRELIPGHDQGPRRALRQPRRELPGRPEGWMRLGNDCMLVLSYKSRGRVPQAAYIPLFVRLMQEERAHWQPGTLTAPPGHLMRSSSFTLIINLDICLARRQKSTQVVPFGLRPHPSMSKCVVLCSSGC